MSDTFQSLGDLATRLTRGAREARVRLSLPKNPTADHIIAAMAERLMAATEKTWGKGDLSQEVKDGIRKENLTRKMSREIGERAKAAILADPEAASEELAKTASVTTGSIDYYRKKLVISGDIPPQKFRGSSFWRARETILANPGLTRITDYAALSQTSNGTVRAAMTSLHEEGLIETPIKQRQCFSRR